MSERWCVTKLVALKEFTSTIAIMVYTPPTADCEAAADVMNTTVSRLQTQQHNTFVVMNGDFNDVMLDSSL